MTAPCYFVTHGAPTLAVQDSTARRFLSDWTSAFDGAHTVIVVSAHWQAAHPTISLAPTLDTIHDFRGFPDDLYRITYPARGAPDRADQVVSTLHDAGLSAATDQDRGLDHGAWIPLMLMRPAADIPIVALSSLADQDPEAHDRLGQALKPLRDDGFAILASGSMTHNLSQIGGHDDPPSDWSEAFSDWFADKVAADDRADLLDYRRLAPHAVRAHPHDDHLMPFYVALGAGGAGTRIHHSTTYRTLAMDAYSFA